MPKLRVESNTQGHSEDGSLGREILLPRISGRATSLIKPANVRTVERDDTVHALFGGAPERVFLEFLFVVVVVVVIDS
jgi:hypothetical protein